MVDTVCLGVETYDKQDMMWTLSISHAKTPPGTSSLVDIDISVVVACEI